MRLGFLSSLFLLCCSILLGHTALGPRFPSGFSIISSDWWETNTQPAKPIAGPANDGRLLGGRNGFFQAFSERFLSVPLLCSKTTAHWALAATHSSLRLFYWCLLMIINILNALCSPFLFTHAHLLLSDFHWVSGPGWVVTWLSHGSFMTWISFLTEKSFRLNGTNLSRISLIHLGPPPFPQ